MTKRGTAKRYTDRSIKASEFKAKCLTIMDEVRDRRAEVVITKRGKAVAKLVPADEILESPIGFMRGTVVAEEDIVTPDPEAWANEDDS